MNTIAIDYLKDPLPSEATNEKRGETMYQATNLQDASQFVAQAQTIAQQEQQQAQARVAQHGQPVLALQLVLFQDGHVDVQGTLDLNTVEAIGCALQPSAAEEEHTSDEVV